jgi:hypothetical protein
MAFLDWDCGEAHFLQKHLPACEKEQIRSVERRENNHAAGPLKRQAVAGLWREK